MRVLFDQGVPVPLRRELPGIEVSTAFRMGWSRLSNGELLAAAESSGFEVFLTTDQNLCYQQNLSARKIAIVVLPTTEWATICRHAEKIRGALGAAQPGSFIEMTW